MVHFCTFILWRIEYIVLEVDYTAIPTMTNYTGIVDIFVISIFHKCSSIAVQKMTVFIPYKTTKKIWLEIERYSTHCPLLNLHAYFSNAGCWMPIPYRSYPFHPGLHYNMQIPRDVLGLVLHSTGM